jgi:zinc protease
VDTPMSPGELTMARDSIVYSLPSDFETSGRTVGTLSDLFVFDLGLDYYSTLPASIAAVTAASAQAAAKAHLDPATLIVIAVGDRARIEAPLRRLNLGTLVIRPVP